MYIKIILTTRLDSRPYLLFMSDPTNVHSFCLELRLNKCLSLALFIELLVSSRPFFRYSHRNSKSQCSARHTPSSDECSQCLRTHLIRPSSSTLACEQGHRDRLAHNHLPGLNRELPPLEGVPSHTQGHHFVRCPHHQPSCDQKSSG